MEAPLFFYSLSKLKHPKGSQATVPVKVLPDRKLSRYHESLNNLTFADVYFGRGQTILPEREKIKRQTIEQRRLQHADAAA